MTHEPPSAPLATEGQVSYLLGKVEGALEDLHVLHEQLKVLAHLRAKEAAFRTPFADIE